MTENQKEYLKSIGIIEEDLQYCYITKINQVFTPLKDKDGKMLKTGEQFYNEDYLNPQKPQPTKTELLKKQLLETQALVAELRYKNILKENGGVKNV